MTEQEKIRRNSLEQIRQLGIEPYPSALFPVTYIADSIIKQQQDLVSKQTLIRVAGRLMTKRIMGSASFFEILDERGRIQAYVRRDDICPGEDKAFYNTFFKKLLDIGDILGLEGFMFLTQTNELTLHVQKITLLAKSLRPLPVVKQVEENGEVKTYDALTDPEMRYRQRYVDLIVNPEVRETFRKRSKMVTLMRSFLEEKGYLEVETPILQPLYGGAAARPFTTHHNTLDTTLYLRIANELYLKRLIVGGYDGVFEFSKDFRNEGMSRFHNPEFTQLELYVAYKDYNWMMDLVEAMVEHIVSGIHGSTEITVGDKQVNFARPWARLTMYDAISDKAGKRIDDLLEHDLRQLCVDHGITVNDSYGRGKLIDALFGDLVEPFLINPTFIIDYPVEMSPLAKSHRTKPGLVERFEVICNSKEICNAFSELNDPIDQRCRFEEQVELGQRGDDEAMVVDEDFLRALEYGMPPTAGLGIGIDRLAMIVCNQPSIQDVLFFPQMRPETYDSAAKGINYSKYGVSEIWQPAFESLSFATGNDFADANANSIFNSLGGYRKKNKIADSLPTQDEIKKWQMAATL